MTVFTPQSANELREIMMRDWALAVQERDPNADPPREPGTDQDLFFRAVANAMMLGFANISHHDKQADYASAEEPELDGHRRAAGLPELVEAPSTGVVKMSIVSDGTAPAVPRTVPGGLTGRLPSGKLVYVDGPHLSVADGGVVSVFTDPGEKTEYPAGTVIDWINPPPGIGAEATVDVPPLTGGRGVETAERKRDRIANSKRFPNMPASPGQLRDDAFESLATVQQAFVYPALGGPATNKLTVVQRFSRAAFSFTRALSATALLRVRQYIQTRYPYSGQYVVTTVGEQNCDVAIQATLPDAVAAGGTGNGWIDSTPWPPLEGGDTRVSISMLTPSGSYDIRVNASTTTAPISNQTHIAWYSPSEQTFHVRRIIASTGSTGAWDLQLESPLVDQTETAAAVGDFISPGMVFAEDYAATWVAQMERLGPGENTADGNRLPRSLRLPPLAELPSGVNTSQLLGLSGAHPEIIDPAYSYRSASAPTVPASVDDDPNILIPRHFGIYPT